MCAGSGCCKCSSAGVGKQVQNFDRASGIADLILRTAGTTAAILESRMVLRREKREGHPLLAIDEFPRIPLRTYHELCHRTSPDEADHTPTGGHRIATFSVPGRDEHPLPADGPDKIIGNFSGIDLLEIFHNLFVPFCDSNLLQN